MIPLQDDRIVLGSTAASAVGLEFGSKIREVDAFAINTFDDSCGFAPLAHFHPDFYGLLLHTYGAADAQVLREAAGRTHIGHSRSLRLLCGRPRSFTTPLAYLRMPSVVGSLDSD